LTTKEQVTQFLTEFCAKYRIFDIIFVERTNQKNVETLATLEISTLKRREIIECLGVADYVSGPVDDTLYGIASLWVFGYKYKNREIYIKISLGRANSNVICISFHIAKYPMTYPFK